MARLCSSLAALTSDFLVNRFSGIPYLSMSSGCSSPTCALPVRVGRGTTLAGGGTNSSVLLLASGLSPPILVSNYLRSVSPRTSSPSLIRFGSYRFLGPTWREAFRCLKSIFFTSAALVVDGYNLILFRALGRTLPTDTDPFLMFDALSKMDPIGDSPPSSSRSVSLAGFCLLSFPGTALCFVALADLSPSLAFPDLAFSSIIYKEPVRAGTVFRRSANEARKLAVSFDASENVPAAAFVVWFVHCLSSFKSRGALPARGVIARLRPALGVG